MAVQIIQLKHGKDKVRDDANTDNIRTKMLLLSLPPNYIPSVSKRSAQASHGQVPVRAYMDHSAVRSIMYSSEKEIYYRINWTKDTALPHDVSTKLRFK